jgi:DNA polymerase (family 10)
MTNAEIARRLAAIATLLEMDGANVFRVRAYREAARVVETLAEPAEVLSRTEGRLQEIKGIGRDLEAKIRDFVTRGTTGVYDELLGRYPASIVELTEIPGLGPKRVKILFEQLGIRDRDELRAAAAAGRLQELPGFGETVQRNLLKALAAPAAGGGRMLLAGAWQVAHDLAGRVRQVAGVGAVELAGSFRRRRETVGDLDVLVCGGAAADVMAAFVGHPYVAEVLARGDTKSSVRLGNGLQVDLRRVPEESFGAALVYFTGSKQHNIELRRIAIERGLSLNEYGLTRGGKTVAARTEEDVYRALGLAWIPPELREAGDEIERARDGRLPRLIEEKDLRADLHMHTDRSDGRDTLADMVRACRDHGYEYCAITEHSQALGMTRGFDAARVRESVEELAAVRKEVPGIRVLHGLEVDILADGTLDLDPESLDRLDWVIVSLHSSLAQPRDVMTRRVLAALEHPAVCVMGHPSGRKIGARDPAAIDFERVFARAAELGVAMEINAQPDRLDLSDANARLARTAGLPIAISTDAHTAGTLDYMRYGVFNARRAGLEPRDVLNTLPFAAFDEWRRRKKGGARPVAQGATATAGAEPAARGGRAKPAARGGQGKPPARGSRASRPAGGGAAKPAAPAARPEATKKKAAPRRGRG